MKKNILTSLLLTASVTALSAQTLVVSEDAFISRNNPTSNYGTNATIYADFPSGVKTYLKFDASGISGSITDITSFTGVDTKSSLWRAPNFYLITGTGADSWDQNTITWNNAPGNDTSNDALFLNNATFTSTLIGSTNIATTGPGEVVSMNWETGAMALVMNELNTGDRIATIGFTRNSTRSADFASLENTSYDAMQMTVVPEPSNYPLILGIFALATISIVRRRGTGRESLAG